MQTARQSNGSQAEDAAAAWLEQAGWRLLARNVKLGKDEIDIVAIDPGPPLTLVCVEVRSSTSPDFGTAEERINRGKVAHLYRAARKLKLAQGLPKRVDLLVVDRRGGRSVFRHLRAVEPP
jgi:putative endonuclease